MLTEAEMTYEDMRKAVDNGYLCAVCQGRINVAWSADKNCYVLRCGKDIEHAGITRHDLKYEKKIREALSMDSNSLMTMDEAKMLQRVEMARFPQELTVADKKLLAQVAITYGFDPLMGEITIYEGRPYVSIDGRYRKAQETGRLDGVETRPATKQERQDWQIPEEDWFFKSEVYVKDASHPFVAWGRVRASETKPGSRRQGDTTSTYKPIQNNPQRMGEKRAEGQALRKAFHIPLPSIEDIGSPDYDIDSTARVVDTTTGEITENPTPKPSPAPATKRVEPPQDKGDAAEWENLSSASETPPETASGASQKVNAPFADMLAKVGDAGLTAKGTVDLLKSRAWATGLDFNVKKLSDLLAQMTMQQLKDFDNMLNERLEIRG